MMRTGMAMVLAFWMTTAAQAKLEIQNIQPVHGPLGPVRPNLDVYPHDELLFRFVVTGAKVDPEGKFDATLMMHLTDPSGKVLVDNEKIPLKGVLTLGAQTYSGTARLNVGEEIAPGEYTFTVTMRDNLSGEEASFQRKLTAKPVGFQIVAPRFFYDPDGKVPAPAGGLVGQNLHFRLQAIGFDRSLGKIDTAMTVQVLDAEGKELLPKPLLAELRAEDAATVKKVSSATFNGSLALTRPGRFTLRITLNDRLGKKTTQFETPLDVRAP
jgi:hypothetical protein